MNILCTDLDNTLIYSYKHDIGHRKRNVEIYQGREISFVTDYTYQLLCEVQKQLEIIPVTTRTEEQYKRIDLGIGSIKYALVCNGGVLLKDGQRDFKWLQESKNMIKVSDLEMKKSLQLLEQEKRRKFELRYIDELLIFTKCSEPEVVVKDLKRQLDTNVVNVFQNGEKVYVVPVNLSKGKALKRLRNYLEAETILAAGDSEFDISMVKEADRGYVPHGFTSQYPIDKTVFEMSEGRVFSESFLETIQNQAAHIE